MFRSTGSYEPDHSCSDKTWQDVRFRSTGSYEPDRSYLWQGQKGKSFDPQALTSLTGCHRYAKTGVHGFDPQALTSLTSNCQTMKELDELFRSTGSYEPDLSFRMFGYE